MTEEMTSYIESIRRMRENVDYVFSDELSFEEYVARKKDFIRQSRETIEKNEAFLKTFLGRLEEKDALDEADKKALEEFAAGLNTGTSAYDDGILLRIAKLQYRTAMKGSDLNEQVKGIYNRAYYEYAVRRMSPTYPSFRGFEEIREYTDLYDLLSLDGKKYFMRCWCNQLLHLGYPWQERKRILDFVLKKKEEDPENGLPYDNYILVLYRNIKSLQSEIVQNDRKGIPNDPGALALACEATDYIYEHMSQMKNSPRANRLIALFSYHTGRFHAGKITIEELITELDKLSEIKEDYSLIEKSSVYFRISLSKCLYASRYGNYSPRDVMALISSQFEEVSKFISELKISDFNSSIAVEYWGYLNSMIDLMHFDKVKPYFHAALQAMDKDLYAHSVLTLGIAILLTRYLLEIEPSFFLDPEFYPSEEEVLRQKSEIEDRIYMMSLLHDIGMYRFLNVMKIRHRYLTPEETEALGTHVLVADRSVQDTEIPGPICDGIVCHHLPYSERRTERSRTMADLLHFASDLEKYTNPLIFVPEETLSFGRFLERAETLSGTEYHPSVVRAAQAPELKAKLEQLLTDDRLDFMFRCSTGKPCSPQDIVKEA